MAVEMLTVPFSLKLMNKFAHYIATVGDLSDFKTTRTQTHKVFCITVFVRVGCTHEHTKKHSIVMRKHTSFV